jgi:hypothetical protein
MGVLVSIIIIALKSKNGVEEGVYIVRFPSSLIYPIGMVLEGHGKAVGQWCNFSFYYYGSSPYRVGKK